MDELDTPKKPINEQIDIINNEKENILETYNNYLVDAYQKKLDFESKTDVKYLGIIIEKDAEYSSRFCAGEMVKREYFSTRGKYMELTKFCKKSMDKIKMGRGQSLLAKTTKKLMKKA